MKVYEYKEILSSKSGKKNHLLAFETSNTNSYNRKTYIIFGYFHSINGKGKYKGELIDQYTFNQIMYPKSRRISEETIIIKSINFIILSKKGINLIKSKRETIHHPISLGLFSEVVSHNSILIENKIILNSKGQFITGDFSELFSNKKRDLKIKV